MWQLDRKCDILSTGLQKMSQLEHKKHKHWKTSGSCGGIEIRAAVSNQLVVNYLINHQLF